MGDKGSKGERKNLQAKMGGDQDSKSCLSSSLSWWLEKKKKKEKVKKLNLSKTSH